MMTSLEPLGDQAALASFANEAAALRFAATVRQLDLPGLVDVVQAYSTVAVFYDLEQVDYADVVEILRRSIPNPRTETAEAGGRIHHIPCCYNLQVDLARVAQQTSLTPEDVIQLHAETIYTVYAIGFCPGFPYLGYLPPPLCGVPRLPTPRVRVEPGSVGLTGRQTGIYTEPRPGGWNLIGRTPLQLVDVADGYFPLRTGDRVQFVPIDETTFRQLRGRRL